MPTTKTISDKTLHKRLYLYSLLFFAILLPFQPKWLPITLGMMIFGLIWLLTLSFREKLIHLAQNKFALLLLVYYIWVVVGAFYSSSPQEAQKDLLSKLPFAVWPLVLGSLSVFFNSDKRLLIRVFVFATFISALYCITTAAIDYQISGSVKEFFFVQLVDYKLISPHYLGMYITFAFALTLDSLLRGEFFFSRGIDIALLLIFFISVILISVRMQFLVFAIVSFWIIFNHTRKSRGWGVATLYSLILIVVFASLTWMFPGSRNRVKDTYHEMLSFKKEVDLKQTNHRKFLWGEAWGVIRDNWLIGTGTGAANKPLNQRLVDNDHPFWDGTGVYYLRDKNYNIHNVYLQHWATHGIIGLLLILSILFIPLFTPISMEGRIFLIICALSFITESMLERQAGVLFFSFFYSIFFILKTPPGKKMATA